jgi:hypothetical protein
MVYRKMKGLFLLGSAVAGWALPAGAATQGPPPPINVHVVYNCFVSPGGTGANSGTADSPWSLNYALGQVGPSSTINLLPGTYPSVVVSRPGLTLRAAVKWTAVILGSTNMHGVEIDADDTTVDGLQVSHSYIDGIKLNSSGDTVRNCWIHHSGLGDPNAQANTNGTYTGQGIYGGCHENNFIENNLIEYNGVWTGHDHGIYLCGTNAVIRGNVIRHNWTYGIQLYTGYPGESCSGIQVYNNLVYGNGLCDGGRNCLTVWAGPPGSGAATTNYVFNNTLVADTYYPVVANYGFLGLTNNIILGAYDGSVIGGYGALLGCDYNLFTNAVHVGDGVMNGGHNLVTTASPGFVNAANGLFWLRTDSPARGAADPNLVPPMDFFDQTQPGAADLGAFQFNSILSTDTRVLDPSPAVPDYWTLP